MGTYGLLQDDSEEGDSLDNIPQHQNTRKRTYPVAFPVEEPAEIYPYNTSVPVAIDKESQRGCHIFRADNVFYSGLFYDLAFHGWATLELKFLLPVYSTL